MPQLADSIIDHGDVDWSDLLSYWAWLLPSEVTVWIMNRYGDLFLVVEDGSVQHLDVGGGSLQTIAESRDAFSLKLDEGDNANLGLMIPLVDELVAAGVTLGPGQCYSYLQLPVLGGEYTVANTRVATIEDHFKRWGPIHEKLKDVPDGTHVQFRIE